MASRIKELSPEQISYFCNPSQFKFESTAELKPLDEVIGQDRAVAAIDFGVEIKHYGYNIFALGPVGAGKTSTIRDAVAKRALEMPAPDDWCYVYNFQNPDEPNALALHPGMGKLFRKSMQALTAELRREIPAKLTSKEYLSARAAIIEEIRQKQNQILVDFDERIKQDGFSLVKAEAGLALAPFRNNQVLTPEQFQQLTPEEKKQIEKAGAEIQRLLNDELQKVHNLDQDVNVKVDEFQKATIKELVQIPLQARFVQFEQLPEVENYLRDVENDLIEHAGEFLLAPDAESGDKKEAALPDRNSFDFNRYLVNLIVDNSETMGAPVIIETNPTYSNLIGRIERISQMGLLVTNFKLIKGGALHKANHGFLIIDASQLFQSDLAWQALKRALKNKVITITEPTDENSFMAVKTIEPEPIPLDVKIVLIGNTRTYYLLLNTDEEFRKLFKVKADFNTDMPRTRKNILNYARFIRNQCEIESLRHLDAAAVSAVVEYGVSLTGDQLKLSTHFADICDLLIESNYWAGKNHRDMITREDVKHAIDAKNYRLNKYEIQLRDIIEDKTISIRTRGKIVGEVNGLAVINVSDHFFGRPTRISVRTYLGRNGVTAIDREAKMSGPIHNKGVLIISGYLNGMFGSKIQLALSASITFEQNYEAIDGDSASSTELYALLSSLADFPINQGIAVTGSVNQMGEVQAIGGVSKKIDGFFEICASQGLTGQQGVIIPQTNMKNLVCSDRVIEAVRAGQFHIYPVATVEEGIEILTGVRAGHRQKNGEFPKGTVFRAVEDRLREMAEQIKNNEHSSRKKKRPPKKDVRK
ncbi:MAG: Lon protease family protein [Candidatus Zhuqueibacterota bacterium]